MASPEAPQVVPLNTALVPALLTLVGTVVTVWAAYRVKSEDRRAKNDATRQAVMSKQAELAFADNAGLRTDLLARIRSLEARADDYVEKYARLSGEHAKLQETHEAVLRENEELKAEVVTNREHITSLGAQVQALTAQVASLTAQLTAHQAVCPGHAEGGKA